MRNALVVSEIAFACVLLVGAGLLIRSLVRVLDVDMGFQPARAATIRVDPDSRYTTREQRNAYFDEVLRRVKEIPGVESAGITDALPLGRNRTWGARAKGVTYERGRVPRAFVAHRQRRLLRRRWAIPLRAGRDISAERHRRPASRSSSINETMARTLWPGQDPIGKFVLGGCAKERRVVGVVGDVRHLALEQASGNEMYLPMRQCGDQPSADLVVRSTLAAGARWPARFARTLKPIAAEPAGNDFRTLQQLVDKSVSPRRFLVLLLGGFAAFALVLASLGIYGLISYSVNQRTQEIGIRMALGASARDVQRRIIAQTLRLAAIGMAHRHRRVVGAGAERWRPAVRRHRHAIPATFVGMLVVLTIVAAAGRLPAGAPRVAHRSDGGAAGGVDRRGLQLADAATRCQGRRQKGQGRTALNPFSIVAFTALAMAARLASTSAAVVAHDDTLIRIAVRPCHSVPPHQHVPSCWMRAITARVRSGEPNDTSTWLMTTSLRISWPASRSACANLLRVVRRSAR